MTPQLYQEQLLKATNDISEAREKLANAQARLMELIGYAHVFGMAFETAPATPEVTRISDLSGSGKLPESTLTSQTQDMRALGVDLVTQALRDGVPHSARSAPVLEESGPNVEAPIELRVGQFEDQRKTEQEGHFLGSGSLFARYLSPSVATSAKGFLKPGVAGLQQFTDDVTRLSTAKLMNWPTGFYRSQDTKEQQFLLVCDKGAIVLPALPDLNFVPLVSLKQPGAPTALVPLKDIALMDLLVLKESVERVLQLLMSTAA